MGFFDKAKAALGLGSSPKPDGEPAGEEQSAASGGRAARDALRSKSKKDGRPPLKDVPKATAAGTLDDALAARDAGHPDEARRILAAIDRGKGLRTLLRAAAALEAKDEAELSPLLPALQHAEPVWMVPLQIASASDAASPARAELVAFAQAHGAPPWALAWTRASGTGDEEKRRGLVDLLFADAPLARTVAARDVHLADAEEDRDAIERYASFAHGRDAIRRFGAEAVASVVLRARRQAS